jgi:ubiquitin-conjugating enzyme E2 Z
MSRAIKRICSDLTKLHKSNINEHGIYYHYDEEDVFNMKAMMVGPEGTPYFGGAYFFDIKFPKTYPLQPPMVKTMTQGNKTRFNPNLYVDGKVCLSMLNTWSGPGWTPCNSIESVLLSIQAMVLVKDPLKNEPGYETASQKTLDDYSSIIRYENIRISMINMHNKPPNGYEIFRKDFLNEYNNRYPKIMEIIKKYSSIQDGKKINSTYGMSRTINYSLLIPKLKKIYTESMKTVSQEDVKIVENVVNDDKSSVEKPLTELAELTDSDVKKEKVIEVDEVNDWFHHGMYIVKDKNEAIEYLNSFNLNKLKISELRELCDKYKIPTKKKSKKTGKMIWKFKKELTLNINYFIDHLKYVNYSIENLK